MPKKKKNDEEEEDEILTPSSTLKCVPLESN